jgi:hypothetical protein
MASAGRRELLLVEVASIAWVYRRLLRWVQWDSNPYESVELVGLDISRHLDFSLCTHISSLLNQPFETQSGRPWIESSDNPS